MAVKAKTPRGVRVIRTPVRKPKLQTSPFDLPAASVIHEQALRMVRDADLTVARLAHASDTEALHNARVALRRLRSWFLDFKDSLPLKHKQRRQLQALTHGSNLGRDIQVCMTWLNAAHTGMDTRALPGARQLVTLLTQQHNKSQAQLRRRFPAQWQRLSHKLKHTLAGSATTDGSPFLRMYLAALQVDVDAYMKAYGIARQDPAPAKIHRLRIAAKRVRYLVEVILPWHARAKPLVGWLKQLQDRAGQVQDLQRLMEFFETAFARKLEIQYRTLLNAYADPEVREQLLPPPARAQSLGS
ncbi:MAG: CHAD domain-containing protein, partial [Gammaproteobacteria bacterium]